jgi:hypothetical protein
MISRPAMYPVLLVLQPQVRLPADSNKALQEIQVRTLILIGDRFASLRAWFFSSMSLTTDGGSLFTLLERYSFDTSILMHASLSMGFGPHTNTDLSSRSEGAKFCTILRLCQC